MFDSSIALCPIVIYLNSYFTWGGGGGGGGTNVYCSYSGFYLEISGGEGGVQHKGEGGYAPSCA